MFNIKWLFYKCLVGCIFNPQLFRRHEFEISAIAKRLHASFHFKYQSVQTKSFICDIQEKLITVCTWTIKF